MKWEYRVEICDYKKSPTTEDFLNALGVKGWELIQINENPRLFFFKRLLEEKEERC